MRRQRGRAVRPTPALPADSQEGDDYLWGITEHQERLSRDIAPLVTTPPLPALPAAFLSATSVDTAHGRYEERRLTASSLLVGDTTWPAAHQVFPLPHRTLMADGRWQSAGERGAGGMTRLPPTAADAARLLALARGHRGIENEVFSRRDVTVGADRSVLRQANAPQPVATRNDLTVGLLRRDGHTNAAAARRISTAFPQHAFTPLAAA